MPHANLDDPSTNLLNRSLQPSYFISTQLEPHRNDDRIALIPSERGNSKLLWQMGRRGTDCKKRLHTLILSPRTKQSLYKANGLQHRCFTNRVRANNHVYTIIKINLDIL
ncbi:hypothetical protein AC240_13575 [Ralstonia sp. MD27]|nr:hypothetical protein AC240_13575 [Ralstonia sp. MD27]